MGMYTELILGCKLKSETPNEIIDVLTYMTVKDQDGFELPEAWPFPADSRHKWMFWGGSYYFGVTHGTEPYFQYDAISKAWILSTRSNIKNYNSEIETFLAWLKPWIEQGSGAREFYAIVTYEEAAAPTIYYLNEP